MISSRSSMAFLPLTSSHFLSLNLVDQYLLERFERAGIKTLIDLSLYTSLELSLKFRLSLVQAEEILKKLFSTLTLSPSNVHQLLIQTSIVYLPTRLPTLNRHFNGGLRRGTLVELCGSWGCGKTQFCLNLTAQCCLMGLRSIYVDTEQTFSSIRLLNMIEYLNKKQEHLLELVRTETVFDYEALMNTLDSIENELEENQQNNARDESPVLLIIDSIAAPLRMSTASYSREHSLLLFTDCAKRLATRYNLLVLVTNQVTTKRRSAVLNENSDPFLSDETKSVTNEFYMSVALGKAWSYSVNVRLAISYHGDNRRQLIIGKSIESPSYTISFRILADGLEELDETLLMNTQQRRSYRPPMAPLIQADEMQLVGKQLRP